MSEIKGQILGIILAIGVFSAVFGVLTIAFKSAANSVGSRMDEVTLKEYQDTTPQASPYIG